MTKLILDRQWMLDAATYADKCVAGRTTKEVLTRFLLRYGSGRATLAATNLRDSAVAELRLKDGSDETEGQFLISPDRLLHALKNNEGFKDAEIKADDGKEEKNKPEWFELVIDGEEATATFQQGEVGFDTYDHADFPSELVPPFDPGDETRQADPNLTIRSEDLARMIGEVVSSAAKADTKYMLTGVLFEKKHGKLTLVATDTKCLSISTANAQGDDMEFLLPADAARVLMAAAQSHAADGGETRLQLNHSHTQVGFYLGRYQLSSATLQGKYPPYRDILIKTPYYQSKVKADNLDEAVTRSTPPADDKLETKWSSHNLTFTFADKLTLESGSPGAKTKARTELQIDPCEDGLALRLDSTMLRPALKANRGNELTIQINQKATLFQLARGDEFLFLQMPLA
jgi:DNA polymerase III sliding clamp (beta) subunit (PCNA family)